jgi:hypothetical protein
MKARGALTFLVCLRLGVALEASDFWDAAFALLVLLLTVFFDLAQMLVEQGLEYAREERQRGFDAEQADLHGKDK